MRRIFLSLPLLLGAAGCTVVGFDTPYNKGIESYREGRFAEAAEHFQTALEKQPEFYEAWYNLARVYDELAFTYQRQAEALQKGATDSAVRGNTPAIPDSGLSVAEQRAELLRLGGEMMRKAEDAYEQALALKPDSAPTLISFGMFVYERGDAARAERLLQRATRVQSDRAYPLTALGFFYQRENRSADARLLYERALLLEGNDLLTLYRLGQWHASANNWGPARDYFQSAVAADPSDAPSWKELGMALAKLGDSVRAAQALDKFVSLAATDPAARPLRIDALLQIAALYQSADRHERAVQALWQARNLAPDSPEIAKKLQISYAALGQAENARLIRLQPTRTLSAADPSADSE